MIARGVAALLALACVGCARPPDVIIIVADTLRADRLGAERQGRSLTPFFDELAARGARFTDARATSSWTVPSIASLFTSRMPSQHGVVAFDSKLADGEVTLFECLRTAGYSSMGFTANFRIGPAKGFAQGFGAFQPSMADPKPRLDMLFEGALDFIDDHWTWRRTPWQRLRGLGPSRVLYLHFMEPHAPYQPPDDILRRVGGPPPPGVSAAVRSRDNRGKVYIHHVIGRPPPPSTPLPRLAASRGHSTARCARRTPSRTSTASSATSCATSAAGATATCSSAGSRLGSTKPGAASAASVATRTFRS